MEERLEPDPGVAGGSARREYNRRRERRQQSAPRKPWLLAALLGSSADEKRRVEREKQWAIGAEGEELLADRLAKKCPDVALLHDRRLPGSRANIDHIAVAAAGVFVIDTKRYRGKIEVRKPLVGASPRSGSTAATRPSSLTDSPSRSPRCRRRLRSLRLTCRFRAAFAL
jgi:Nuclease-related domain